MNSVIYPTTGTGTAPTLANRLEAYTPEAIAIIASLLRARHASMREGQQEQINASPGEQTVKAQDHPVHKER